MIQIKKTQCGATLLLFLVFLVGMVGFVGLATDMGNIVVNKTRLQNALDATALSTATVLSNDINRDTAAAQAAGLNTFNLFVGAAGNGAISGVTANSLIFDFSTTLVPFAPGTNPPNFVRVRSNTLPFSPILSQVASSLGARNIPAVSTAGVAGQNCNLTPLVICPRPDASGNLISGCGPNKGFNGAAPGCNGVSFNHLVCLKGGTAAAKNGTCQSAQGQPIPNGNFGMFNFPNLGPGANNVRALLAGRISVCDNVVGWENGNMVGPIRQGMDDRFDADKVHTEYFAPAGYPFSPPTASNLYINDFDPRFANPPPQPFDNPNGIARFRVMQVPIVDDCTLDPPNIIAATCFWPSQRVIQHGQSNEILGELLSSCPGAGSILPSNTVLFGPTKVVLFKTAGSTDS